MKVVIQRVIQASVTIQQQLHASIGRGMMILVGIQADDHEEDIEWLSSKICNLRIFDDENGIMNRSILETAGEILAVSQFTLMARTKKGTVPRTSTQLNRKSPFLCMRNSFNRFRKSYKRKSKPAYSEPTCKSG